MRLLIIQIADREDRRMRLRWETVAAWSEYCESGRHLTAAEADAWLSRLEAGEDAEPPDCHR